MRFAAGLRVIEVLGRIARPVGLDCRILGGLQGLETGGLAMSANYRAKLVRAGGGIGSDGLADADPERRKSRANKTKPYRDIGGVWTACAGGDRIPG